MPCQKKFTTHSLAVKIFLFTHWLLHTRQPRVTTQFHPRVYKNTLEVKNITFSLAVRMYLFAHWLLHTSHTVGAWRFG